MNEGDTEKEHVSILYHLSSPQAAFQHMKSEQ